MAFDGIPQLKSHAGYKIILEEDNFVLPDLLHLLKMAPRVAARTCPDCRVLNFGMHGEHFDYSAATNMQGMVWKHNLGMALDRAFWNKFKGCTDFFCHHSWYS